MIDELQRLIDRTVERAGLADRDAVQKVVQTTLRELGSQLEGVLPALHDALPEGVRQEVSAGKGGKLLRPAELYKQVSERLGVRPGVAIEVVQSALAELGERVGSAGRQQLQEHLPPSWAVLVGNPRAKSRVHVAAKPPEEEGHTLASGRPGSTRPIAEAAPPVGQADSIAASDDPHAERLSSAHGSGPSDEEQTLAAGTPGKLGKSGIFRAVSDSD